MGENFISQSGDSFRQFNRLKLLTVEECPLSQSSEAPGERNLPKGYTIHESTASDISKP